MSNLARFIDDPFGKFMHKGYSDSFLNMRPAPEYASGEVLVSSLYRSVGFPNLNERVVPELGKKYMERMDSENEKAHVLDQETWRLVLNSTLESPKLRSQSTKRFMLLCPVVPWAAAYSGSARLTKNSWNPGSLFGRMVRFGCNSHLDSNKHWYQLFEALSVVDSDDPWANLLKHEFTKRIEEDEIWKYCELESASILDSWQLPEHSFPARQFVQDLDKVVTLKRRLTRRQWVSILESLLRIASVAHIVWLCELNSRAYSLLRNAILGKQNPESLSRVVDNLFSNSSSIWVLEKPILSAIRKIARNYLQARVGINYLLFLADEKGISNHLNSNKIGSVDWFYNFTSIIYNRRHELDALNNLQKLHSVIEKDPRILACKKGIGKNIEEFSRHVLGQRQAADDRFLTYDQGYFAKQRESYKSAPWILSPGPVAVMMFCHCCVAGSASPRTVEHLCEHLSNYKIEVKPNEMATSDLGRTLRNLGLVLDSPDAEGGMVVLDPFRT